MSPAIFLTIKTSGVYDVKRWVLSFGADAVVLEPKNLKEGIFEDICRIGEMYKI